MSMPSSRLLVATTQGRRPRLRSSSISSRCSRETEPWCARAITMAVSSSPLERAWPAWAITCAGGRAGACPASSSALSSPRAAARSVATSLSRAVSRSARRRELANTIVERCCSTRSTTRSSMCGHSDWLRSGSSAAAGRSNAATGSNPSPNGSAAGSAAGSAESARVPASAGPSGAVMSGTGTTTRRSQRFAAGGATISTGARPPRNRATSSSGRTVADRPIRCAGDSSSSSRRSSVSARCAPRFVPATACTSSTITVRTPRSDSRACEVSIRNSDSGVVIMMSGGALTSLRRSAALVSPERTPTATSGTPVPSRAAVCRMPASGARRLRSTSTASAFSGET